MSSNSSFASNSIDFKITLPKNVVERVMEHGVTLDQQHEIACIYCDHYVTTHGIYQFLCHLAGAETKACEGVSEEVKKEMLGILTQNKSSKTTSNTSGSFYGYGYDSVDSKITVSKDVVDVVLEHSVMLDEEDVIGCRYCDDYLVTRGGYHFLCHLAGTENNVKACEGIGEEVKKEVLDIFSAFQEEGCEKRKYSQVAVESSRDIFKRRRAGSEAIIDNEVKKTLKEEACRAIARFFSNNDIPLNAVKTQEFKSICHLVSRHGLGFEPPSLDEIKGKYLTEEPWKDIE